MKPSEVLEKAAELIAPEGAWTQGRYARGKHKRAVKPDGKSATCWCTVGALRANGVGAWSPAGDYVRKAIGNRPIISWNDAPGRTQAEVVDALKRAAELARSEGQ